MAGVAVLALVGILVAVAARDSGGPRGYVEFTMFRAGCAVDPTRDLNVDNCVKLAPTVYVVNFNKSLAGATAIVSRGVCCAGQVRASVSSDRAVLVAVGKPVRTPIRISLLIP